MNIQNSDKHKSCTVNQTKKTDDDFDMLRHKNIGDIKLNSEDIIGTQRSKVLQVVKEIETYYKESSKCLVIKNNDKKSIKQNTMSSYEIQENQIKRLQAELEKGIKNTKNNKKYYENLIKLHKTCNKDYKNDKQSNDYTMIKNNIKFNTTQKTEVKTNIKKIIANFQPNLESKKSTSNYILNTKTKFDRLQMHSTNKPEKTVNNRIDKKSQKQKEKDVLLTEAINRIQLNSKENITKESIRTSQVTIVDNTQLNSKENITKESIRTSQVTIVDNTQQNSNENIENDSKYKNECEAKEKCNDSICLNKKVSLENKNVRKCNKLTYEQQTSLNTYLNAKQNEKGKEIHKILRNTKNISRSVVNVIRQVKNALMIKTSKTEEKCSDKEKLAVTKKRLQFTTAIVYEYETDDY